MQRANPTEPEKTATSKDDWAMKFAASVTLWMMLISALVVMAVALYVLNRDQDLGKQRPSRTPAGTIEHVSQTASEIALVETDTAFYSVEGGVALNKGEPLTLIAFADRSEVLCTSMGRCMPLHLSKNTSLVMGGQFPGASHE